VPAAGSGSGGSGGSRTGASTRAGLERRKKKKTRLDTSKTLHRESAIALRYHQRLAGGASNPNVTKTTYYMRTLDKQASDS
jgi:hypothetical protein